jgi:cyclophilin family peptidyl-prolyl cis-trans isomerase
MRTKLSTLFLFATVLFAFYSCQENKETQTETIEINLNDAVVQQIFNLRSKRDATGKANAEALKTYLAVENPNHRYIAAMALASVQDSSAIEALGDALKDPYEEVRKAAAFALGQSKHPKAAKLMADYFRQDSVRTVLAEILEAVGRSGTEEQLKDLCASHPYTKKDSLLHEGLALGLYRFALRKMVQPEGTDRIMNDYIGNALMPAKARFIAANYLARVPNLDLSRYENVLINNVQEEKDPNTLMFMVLGLSKVKTDRACKTLVNCFRKTPDYRVRCNVIRGLHNFPYDSSRTMISDALYDTSMQVRITAADYLYNHGQAKDALSYYEWGEKHPNWQLRSRLLAAAIRHLELYKANSKAFMSTKLTMLFNESNNIYEKAAILDALGSFSWNYKFIADQVFPTADSIKVSPILKSHAATALVKIYQNPDFAKELGFSAPKIKEELHGYFKRFVEEGDAGATAIIAEAIANPQLKLKQAFPDYSFLKKAQQSLRLPAEVETYIYLQKAIDYLSGQKSDISNVGKNNFVEVDWPLINALGEHPKVTIKTNKGKIVLELYPKDAPATVMQFIQLVKANYYNGKAFHRVVPNFVAQTGCSRGDGWGGFDVSVVSEFSELEYDKAGRVGMASAGKDTESTQFFITHAPTIHLDGNYTIFAQVVEGMDIVHQLTVGDVMETVEVNK